MEPGSSTVTSPRPRSEHGFWCTPDAASGRSATLGGNVVTAACHLKYGVTRDDVLGLQRVTAIGGLVRLGRRTAMRVASHDLGPAVDRKATLGVVTEVAP